VDSPWIEWKISLMVNTERLYRLYKTRDCRTERERERERETIEITDFNIYERAVTV